MRPAATAIRATLRQALIGDGVLLGLLGGPKVYHRYVRKAVEIPSITYFDYSSHPEPVIPRTSTTIQIDVWARLLDDAEVLAQRVTQLLDLYEAADAGLQPFQVVSGETNIVQCRLEQEFDDLAGESPDIARKTLIFRTVSFELAA